MTKSGPVLRSLSVAFFEPPNESLPGYPHEIARDHFLTTDFDSEGTNDNHRLPCHSRVQAKSGTIHFLWNYTGRLKT